MIHLVDVTLRLLHSPCKLYSYSENVHIDLERSLTAKCMREEEQVCNYPSIVAIVTAESLTYAM